MTDEYDAKRGGIQRIHDHSPSRCWAWARATSRRTIAVHASAGGPVWWRPNIGRKQYAGITEWRAGWLLLAAQVAHRAAPANPSAQTSNQEHDRG